MSASEFLSTFFTPTYLFLFLNLIIGTIYLTSRLGHPRPAKPPHAAPLGRAPSSLIDRVRSIDLSFYKFGTHPEQEPVGYYHYDSAAVDGPPLARAPSLLDRFRSINFYQKKFEHSEPEPEPVHAVEAVYGSEPPPLSRAPSLLDQLKSINFYHHKSDPEPVRAQIPAPLARAPSFLECVRSIKFPSLYNPGEPNQDAESDHEDADHRPPEDRPAHSPVRRIRSESERMGEQGQKPRMRKTASEKSVAAEEAEEKIDTKADDFIQRFRNQLRLERLDSIMRYKDMLTGGGGATS